MLNFLHILEKYGFWSQVGAAGPDIYIFVNDINADIGAKVLILISYAMATFW